MNDDPLPGFTVTLLGTLGATALVALIAWGALAALRRLTSRGTGRSPVAPRRAGRLKVLQNVPLGARERAVLIADDEHEYLLGVAAGGVSLLAARERRTGGRRDGDDAGTTRAEDP